MLHEIPKFFRQLGEQGVRYGLECQSFSQTIRVGVLARSDDAIDRVCQLMRDCTNDGLFCHVSGEQTVSDWMQGRGFSSDIQTRTQRVRLKVGEIGIRWK
jgi:hypothetical protein